jgi:hypothetical protein
MQNLDLRGRRRLNPVLLFNSYSRFVSSLASQALHPLAALDI